MQFVKPRSFVDLLILIFAVLIGLVNSYIIFYPILHNPLGDRVIFVVAGYSHVGLYSENNFLDNNFNILAPQFLTLIIDRFRKYYSRTIFTHFNNPCQEFHLSYH